MFTLGERNGGEAGRSEHPGAKFGCSGGDERMKAERAKECGETRGFKGPSERLTAETEPSADGGATAAECGAAIGPRGHESKGDLSGGQPDEVGEDFPHASFGKIHQETLGHHEGASARIKAGFGKQNGRRQDAEEVGGKKCEVGCDFERGGFRLLRGGMIEFKETDRWVSGVKAAGEGIKTGAEDDDLLETGGQSGGRAGFEPTFAGEVVGDDAGKDEAFAREEKRSGPSVASGKF